MMTESGAEGIGYHCVEGENHLALQGVVDLFVAASFHDIALKCVESGRATRVDCRQLERIDGSALQLLLVMARDHHQRAAEFTLLGVPDDVSRYLRLAGARPLLDAVREAPAIASDDVASADAEVAATATTDPNGVSSSEG
jgi:anti-anti-sigma factor